jgi:hypothetical protein
MAVFYPEKERWIDHSLFEAQTAMLLPEVVDKLLGWSRVNYDAILMSKSIQTDCSTEACASLAVVAKLA